MKKREKLKVKNEYKFLIALSIVFLLIVFPLCFLSFCIPKFYVKDFTSFVKVDLFSDYHATSGEVCYGNIFSCKEVQLETKGEVDTSKVGEYKISYIYTFDKKTIEKEQIVKVVDELAPVLNVSNEELVYCPNGHLKEYQVEASDNYDGDLTSQVVRELKDGKIVFQVSDSSGNETIVEKEATMKDEVAPVLTLNGDSIMYLKVGSSYEEKGASAYDDCDEDLTSNIVMSGSVNTKTAGTYEINYTVTDSSSNTASLKRVVYVYQNNDTVTPTGKSIYLTFDDGPGKDTARLLDILKKYNVKATFFVTNQGLTKGYDNVILRAFQEGHTIGLHSYTHDYGIYSSVQSYFDDLNAIQDKVKRITGYTSWIIRFPGGSSNTVSKSYDGGTKIMSQLTKAVEAKGFHYFDWNIESKDAGGTTSSSGVSSNIIKSLGSNSTYIVLQHDIKSYSVDAVETVIQYGLSHGYTFRPITVNTPAIHHHVNN